MLMKSVTGAYEEAAKYRFTSIAMPAISSGIYGYPLAPCTQAILEATKDYFKDNPRSTLQQVYFVSIDIPVCEAFESSMKSVFMGDEEELCMAEDDDFVGLEAEASATESSSNFGMKIDNDVVTTKEGFDIMLMKGRIEDSKVDVIVNSTSHDLNLNSGNVSKALLQAAGPQLQQECSAIKATEGNIPVNGFVETGPAALKCQKVFHISPQHYQGAASMQNITILLKTILSSASSMRSIAIPALGTGNLKYPAHQVSNVMYEEAIEFSANHPRSNLKEIHFVVYYKDTNTISAFDSEIKNLKYLANEVEKTTNQRDLGKRMEAVNLSQPTAADHITSSSPHKHFRRLSRRRAEMEIGCVTVTVEQGDITTCDADAIVNLTSNTFNLCMGAVSNAILKAGGTSIQTECTNNMKSPSLTFPDEIWTGSGRLNCSAICHLPISNDINQQKTMLVKIMATANVRKYNKIAFPAIGTGNSKKSPKEAATLLFDCILKFSKKENPTSLRKIMIIVFEMPMTLEFISTMEDLHQPQLQSKGFFQRSYDYMKAKVRLLGSEETTDEDVQTSPQLSLRILSLDEEGINGAKSRIQSIIAGEMTEEVFHKDAFSKFTPQQIAKLKKIAGDYEVAISTRKIKSNIIELQGRRVNVMKAQKLIYELIVEIQEKQLILKDVKWFYTGVNNEMVEFDGDITVLLEKAFQKKKNEVTYTTRNNHKFKVNLKKMPMEETDLTLNTTNMVIRNESTMNLPSDWSPMTEKQKSEICDLQPISNEYHQVEIQFTAALGSKVQLKAIVKISRIQNIELWKQYAIKKEAFKKTMEGQGFERTLYHGTDDGTITKINNTGFNRSYAGKNVTAFGKGTYFATSAAYSAQEKYSQPNANGEKHILMCSVLVGKCTKGTPDMLAPPAGFDSVCDDPANPKIIVIFHDVQAYPSYLITFKLT
ncbi:protein mono-ADP-ribosyltransferase PARP14-like [Antedon mediterranea]|uniref:protein mono-ADP-ribosyltransferase PARP14-like n=1 Tax=Antedon mediterranea TaxID=105859 RepID=UPI003AF66411